MKKLIYLFIGLLLMIPTVASAHTELTSSNPAANQVIKKDLKEVVLTYEGKIESLSTMDLVKDGQKISFVSVTPKENQLIGTLSAPLDNGSYTIKWSIAGEDGHPINGEIPFTVQKEVKLDQKTETKEPISSKKEESKIGTNKQEQTNKQTGESPSSLKNIITIAVVMILVIGLFLLFRRKR